MEIGVPVSFRFFQRIRLAPGLTLNLAKTSASLSFGPKGAKFTAGTRGTRATVGLPGSGLFYTVANPLGKRRPAAAESGAGGTAAPPKNSKLSLGFFKRLTTPADEQTFVDGLVALGEGREKDALERMKEVVTGSSAFVDAAWIAGVLSLKYDHLDNAIKNLEAVLRQPTILGLLFGKYAVLPRVELPITLQVVATIVPSAHSTRLALVEAYQRAGRPADAVTILEALLALEPEDPVALASYSELVLDGNDHAKMKRVIEMTASLANDGPVHTAVLLYRGKALAKLGMDTAAVKVWSDAMRRTKDRLPELLREIRYQRANAYQRLGQRAQARGDWERIYADDPGFEDVAHLLGL
jgi:tetratricopeptide (TPR) repeat protein